MLAYVDARGRCFFAPDHTEAWGDDWDDAPYQHNAGPPYDAFIVADIIVVGDYETPDGTYSVADINGGAVPWLSTSRYAPGPATHIFAGTPISEVMRLAALAGWRVFADITSPTIDVPRSFTDALAELQAKVVALYGRVSALRMEASRAATAE